MKESQKFEGNEKEFQQYNELLKQDFKGITLYYNNRVKKYTGNIYKKLYEGRGILYDESGEMIYDGFFKKGKYEGFGKQYEEKLLKYEGFFSNDKYEGRGNLFLIDDKIYEGYFHEGVFSGLGKIYKMNHLFYEGNFENGNMIGNGIKYYKNGNKHIEGKFRVKNKSENFDFKFKENYAKGILYDNNGNYICENEFVDFIPLNGKNKILIANNKQLIFDDDIYNSKYSENGKLYKREQEEYILNYEGNFKNGDICGKGIKFYKNGKKKFEGNFKLIDVFEGIYYSPKGNIIFKGKIENEFFYDSEFLEIYNNDGYLLYQGKIEDDSKNKDNYQKLKDIILCRDKISNNYNINMKLNKTSGKAIFISSNHSGRTAIIERLINNKFFSELYYNFMPSHHLYDYTYNNIEYSLKIFNLHGEFYQHKELYKLYLKDCNIYIYVVDFSINEYEEEIIDYLHENIEKSYKFIYLVMNKIDINKKNVSKLESLRNHARKLILEGSIYRYFELSAKTEEGFDEFKKCLKFDLDLSLKFDELNNNSLKPLEINHILSRKLNKYLDY